MKIAPAGLQNNYSNGKSKANTSFGMNLSRTGQITIDVAKREKAIGRELYNTFKYIDKIKPDPAPGTDDILLGFERQDGPGGRLVALLGTKDSGKFSSESFEFNQRGFERAFVWATNKQTINELRAK